MSLLNIYMKYSNHLANSKPYMFGGYGIYHNDLMFALVAGDDLYLKTDAVNLAFFEQLDVSQFEFVAKNKTSKMS